MAAAARTAPKGKGIDVIEIALVTDDDIRKLSDKMIAMAEENGMKFFLRDANNVEAANAVVVIGTRLGVFRLNCGYCGFRASFMTVFLGGLSLCDEVKAEQIFHGNDLF